MDYATLIEKRTTRLAEIEEMMSVPDFFNDQSTSTAIMREHRSLKRLLEGWEKLQLVKSDIEGNEELLSLIHISEPTRPY